MGKENALILPEATNPQGFKDCDRMQHHMSVNQAKKRESNTG